MPRRGVACNAPTGHLLPKMRGTGAVTSGTILIMKTVTLQDIQRKGLRAIPKNKSVFLITDSDEPSHIILPHKEHEKMEDALDDYESILAIRERKNDKDVSWEEVFPEDKE